MNDKELRIAIAETIERHVGGAPAAAHDASAAIMERFAITVESLPPHVRRSPNP